MRRGFTIDDARVLATQKGGVCLSDVYVHRRASLQWQCSEGHVFASRPDNVKHNGRWCPHCSGNARLTIEIMQKRAAERGGKCLSTTYSNSVSKLTWECAEGHVWVARASTIPAQWCPTCYGKAPLTLEDMQARAAKRGGKCLSTTYINSAGKLQWQCAEGHVWSAVPSSALVSKYWCPHCAGLAPLTIQLMQETAAERGGECLSEGYINLDTRLTWRCAKKHTWESTPHNVYTSGHWCPYCNTLVGEASCRAWLEQRFGKPFPKAIPEWLRRANGRKLQLDGYNEELKIAFEYQGPQHYRFISWFFHNTPADFEAQQERDAEKAAKCAANGVLLIIVPYNKRPVGKYLEEQLRLRLASHAT